jgi:hypothetical protein
MDPYLEDPYTWAGFHNSLVGEIMTALNRRITPAYFAQIEQRVYISDQDDPGRRTIVPDVRVLGGGARKGKPNPAGGEMALGGVAVCEPVSVTTVIDEEVRESYLRVVERDSRRVVTVIEVLSPTNKVPGSLGRAEYTRKRAAILRSETNWVEIDLLRAGEPVYAEEPYPVCEYTAHVSKVADRPQGMIWPIRLAQRLPVIPIPLRGRDPDVMLDLQPLVGEVYDRSACGVWVDYTKDPTPPLPPESAAWAEGVLKAAELR